MSSRRRRSRRSRRSTASGNVRPFARARTAWCLSPSEASTTAGRCTAWSRWRVSDIRACNTGYGAKAATCLTAAAASSRAALSTSLAATSVSGKDSPPFSTRDDWTDMLGGRCPPCWASQPRCAVACGTRPSCRWRTIILEARTNGLDRRARNRRRRISFIERIVVVVPLTRIGRLAKPDVAYYGCADPNRRRWRRDVRPRDCLRRRSRSSSRDSYLMVRCGSSAVTASSWSSSSSLSHRIWAGVIGGSVVPRMRPGWRGGCSAESVKTRTDLVM